MKVWSLDELGDHNFKPTWLHKGWRSHPSHGQQAGMEKTLKSWIAAAEAVSVAAGLPLFGKFGCVTSGPVVIFTGESGADLYYRRLRHLARSMGIEDWQFRKLPIHIISERATTRSDKFRETLQYTANEFEQVLTVVDPLYSYHGADVEAGNVHAASEVLNAVSDITDEAGSSLNIVNHFRKSGDGRLSLTDITQAGGREWVESWHLIGHRSTPTMEQVRAGEFKLEVVVGGRQWDGDAWGIDLWLGRFNRDTFDYEGKVKWTVGNAGKSSGNERKVVDFLKQTAAPISKNAVAAAVGGNKQNAYKAVDEAVDNPGVPVSTTDDEPPKYYYNAEYADALSRFDA
jgi:AAA domain